MTVKRQVLVLRISINLSINRKAKLFHFQTRQLFVLYSITEEIQAAVLKEAFRMLETWRLRLIMLKRTDKKI